MSSHTKPFLQRYCVTISTLSPVHIGCGEEFDPTNYVMDENGLHYFDAPGLADLLTETDRAQLDKINTSKTPLLAMQKFFAERKNTILPCKTFTRTVSSGIYEKYKNVIGKPANTETDGKEVINALAIARTAFNPYTAMPIFPGSSIKGAIRTAYLDSKNKSTAPIDTKKNKQLEKELLQGAFETDPLRLLKVGDATASATPSCLLPRVVFENNLKRVTPKAGKPTRQLLCLKREVIPAYNGAAFTAELTLQNLQGITNDKTPPLAAELSATQLAKSCNLFYTKLFKKDYLRFAARGCLQQEWAQHAQQLLNVLAPFIQNNAGMLLRIGRHSGSEGVTLNGLRSIKILKGPGKTPGYEKEPTTDWLASEVEKSEVNLIPFGWVFLDLGYPELEAQRQALQHYLLECRTPALTKQAQALQNADAGKDALLQQRAALKAKAQQDALAKAQAQEAERALREAIAAMPPQLQHIEAFKQRIKTNEGKGEGASCNLSTSLRELCEAAQDWPQEYKQALHTFALEALNHLGIDRKKNDKWKNTLRSLNLP